MTTSHAPLSSVAAPAAISWRAEAVSARGLIVLVMAVAFTAALLATSGEASARAAAGDGADLARLLRAMAAIKAAMAAGVAGAVIWRLGAPAGPGRLTAYALACAAMAAGPALVWGLARVGAGALLLHGGLIGAIVLLWRDPAMGARLAAVVEARRARRAPSHTDARAPGL